MANIKSHTDLGQARKLIEFLPLESADMSWASNGFGKPFARTIPFKGHPEELCACWSLAALLAILPNEIITDNRFECHYQIHIRKYDGGDNTTLHQIAYGNDRGSSGSWHDMINTGEKESLIDCCVQMIINLKERNLI